MTDKLITDLTAIAGALADTTAVPVVRSGQTSAEQSALSDWKTWIKSWIAKADVGLSNVANSLQLVAANNLSDLTNAVTARTNLGLGTYYGGPPVATGIANVYASTPTTNTTTGALTALRLYMVPVYWPGGTATTFAITVTTAATAGKIARCGIYNIKADGTPGTLVVEPTVSSQIAVDSTGTKTVSFSQALNAGWYYLAFITDGTPTVSASADGLNCLGIAFSGSSGGVVVTYIFRALGALAALGDETAQTYSASGVASSKPNMGIK